MPDSVAHPALVIDVQQLLQEHGASAAGLEAVLDRVLDALACAVGTLHRLDPTAGSLRLCAQRGLPAELLPRIETIPLGKGMAGIAAERRQPVQVCNLQADASGVAKPAARETRMEGSIAVPLLEGNALRGVLGVAKPVVHEFTTAEIGLLEAVAGVLARFLGEKGVTASPRRPPSDHGEKIETSR